tara:strand:+ start:94 stop:417 length:324 start_codon:yes stop_codon:yes gene_type:complete
VEGVFRLAHLLLGLFPYRVGHGETFTIVLRFARALPEGAIEGALAGQLMVEMMAIIAAVQGLAAPFANLPQTRLGTVPYPWSSAPMAILHFLFTLIMTVRGQDGHSN